MTILRSFFFLGGGVGGLRGGYQNFIKTIPTTKTIKCKQIMS